MPREREIYFRRIAGGRIVTSVYPQSYDVDPAFERLARTEGERLYIQQTHQELRDLLTRADNTVYVVLRSVSRSGMSRRLALFCLPAQGVNDDGSPRPVRPYHITYAAARVLGWRTKDDAIVVDGCGMDMGFHTVYSLGQTLGLDLKHEWV